MKNRNFITLCVSVVNALLHKSSSNPYLSRYKSSISISISTDLLMPNHWAWFPRLLMPKTGHVLKDFQCRTLGTISTVRLMPNTGTISTVLSIPNTGHDLIEFQCRTLGTISTVRSMPNHWAWSQRLSIPNTGHNLNCSINAQHWAPSQLFYQYQTTGHDFRDY